MATPASGPGAALLIIFGALLLVGVPNIASLQAG